MITAEGEINWQQFLKDLREIQYKGIFLMEIRGEFNQKEIFEKIQVFLKNRLLL